MLLGLLLLFIPLTGLYANGKDLPAFPVRISEIENDTGQGKHKTLENALINETDENPTIQSERFQRSVRHCRRVVEDRCTECADGFHGNYCQHACSSRCAYVCFQESGLCRDCPPGYYGSLCDQICPVFCGATDDLTIHCTISNGSCQHGCKKGYYGPHCINFCNNCINTSCLYTNGSCMIGCKSGFWGKNCQHSCPTNCKSKNCSSSGHCIDGCVHGWLGKTCERMCSNKCRDGVCDDRGICTKGCLPGFSGGNCNQTCPHHCHSCDQNRTHCVACNSGFTGPLCEDIHTRSYMNEVKTLCISVVTLLSLFIVVKKRKVIYDVCLSLGSGLKCHDQKRNKHISHITLSEQTGGEEESFV